MQRKGFFIYGAQKALLCPTKAKGEHTEKPTLLRSAKQGKTQPTIVLKTGEADRHAQGVTAHQNRDSQWEPPQKPVLGEETTDVTDELLKALCIQL